MPSSDNAPPAPPREATLTEALLPLGALILLLREAIIRFGGTAHIPLLLAAALAVLVGIRAGHRWADLEAGMLEGVAIGLKAMLILLVVGILIGTWIAGGVVPAMIVYGLKLLSPSVFLAAACVLCCVVSLATGSSWTTAGTVGVALMGIGEGLGAPAPMTAGAIISGAYFGDKLSPLSDTTNLAPAVAGSDLFEHVRYMLHTTLPALAIALVLYAVLGWTGVARDFDATRVDAIRDTLAAGFQTGPLMLVPPALVIGMVALRVPALPALLAGAVIGGAFALVAQDMAWRDLLAAAQKGYVSKTGVESVDALLTRGGLESMLPTISLVLCALAFGGVMERAGLLARLARAILRVARGTGQLVAATLAACIGTNILAADQYLSIVLPGRMLRGAYAERGLEPRLLSRTLEDAGTLSSPLVPWNTCGAFMSATLGVSAAAYLPWAFLNLLCPVIAVVIAFAGWGIRVTPRKAG